MQKVSECSGEMIQHGIRTHMCSPELLTAAELSRLFAVPVRPCGRAVVLRPPLLFAHPRLVSLTSRLECRDASGDGVDRDVLSSTFFLDMSTGHSNAAEQVHFDGHV